MKFLTATCVHCKEDFPIKEEELNNSGSHGICYACMDAFTSEMSSFVMNFETVPEKSQEGS
jgi:hypothetical protein